MADRSESEKLAARLSLRPLTLREASRFVAELHRHHKPPRGMKFAMGAMLGSVLVGVAIVGRPVARLRDDGRTLEVLRVCTDGTPNACSFLYGACARAAWALGYERIGTYTLPEEGGASLRGSGWECIRKTDGGGWSRHTRERTDDHPLGQKFLWERRDPSLPLPEPEGGV